MILCSFSWIFSHYNSYTHEMRNSLAKSIDETMEMLKEADPVP